MSEIFQADLGSGPTPKLVLIALADFAADARVGEGGPDQAATRWER